MGEQLLPCPFCGGTDIGAAYTETYSLDSSYNTFGCKDCNAVFAEGDASDWNTRAPTNPADSSSKFVEPTAAHWRRALESKDAEIAELRARIASAPTVSILGISPTIGIFEYANPTGGFFEATFGECPACPLLGKRVALVLLDDAQEAGNG